MYILAVNPFVSAYLQSDWFGKGIFWSLFILSGISWAVLIHKSWMLYQARKLMLEFLSQFTLDDPLKFSRPVKSLIDIPSFEIYKSFKVRALAIINRNQHYCFSERDLDLLESEMFVSMNQQMKKFEKYLFVLPTVVSLGPFIGLLGTVWGILLSFSHLQTKLGGTEGMLAALSLALATTVLGLVVAIPALIGNNYLKIALKDLRREMEDFSHQLCSSVELHYAREEHAKEVLVP